MFIIIDNDYFGFNLILKENRYENYTKQEDKEVQP